MARTNITLGSLFSGSGGFELAGLMNGITPVWDSEIEKYPMAVTAKRFPDCKQLGDVTKINGAEIEPVDIITFGSPCQDLSVAGKQLGIHEGQRSNLFFEAIRIIKEMRDATANKFPRFAVWENVPGAFSSNKGSDFQAVLQAFCNVRGGANIRVPMPQGGRWQHAGCIVGDGFSIAWRLYDAQYWGVPQRRKRIYLIADFGSERAGEILFKPESMRGDSSPCGEARERTAADAEGGAGGSGAIAFGLANASKAGLSAGSTSDAGGNTVPQICYAIQGNTIDRGSAQNGNGVSEDVSPTINTQDRHGVVYPEVARTLTARHDSSPCIDRGGQIVCTLDCRNLSANYELSATLACKPEGGWSLNYQNPVVYSAASYGNYEQGVGTLRASGGDVEGGGYRR